jgi:hypothetical protein
MRWAVLILAAPLAADDRADQLLKRVAERYATLARYDIEYERTDAGDLATGLPGSSGRTPTVSRYRIAASTGNRIRTEPRSSKLFWISTGDGVIRLNRR